MNIAELEFMGVGGAGISKVYMVENYTKYDNHNAWGMI